MSGPRYAELQVTSHFSFLRGASSCEELFATAAILGVEDLAVVDRNSLAGVVRAHEAAKVTGVRLVVGCRLDLSAGESVLVYPTDRAAYARLCRLLSLGKKRAGKARCDLAWVDLVAYGEGLIAALVPDEADEDCALRLRRLREAFGDRAYVRFPCAGGRMTTFGCSSCPTSPHRCACRPSSPTTCSSMSPADASFRMS
jgi:error-prone DNA polymerase